MVTDNQKFCCTKKYSMKHNRKHTISIGIPAFNESANIKSLLISLLRQYTTNMKLTEIIVVSDASTDTTESEVMSVSDKRIKLIKNSRNLGDALTQNVILDNYSGDILIILNADIAILDPYFIEKMASPIIRHNVDLVSPKADPIKPKFEIEKILYRSVYYKTKIFEKWRNSDNAYLCYGRARAFSQKFAHAIRFPTIMNEDVYSYLFCKSRGYKFYYQSKTSIYFQLPQNLSDHRNQNNRFLSVSRELSVFFYKDYINYHLQIPKISYQLFLLFLLNEPMVFIRYILLESISLYQSYFHPPIPTWGLVTSTKKLSIQKEVTVI
jgi:glycosyltransferase involved in cell wall biosynthesis